ncbi:glycosyltransferase family 4 protein [Riemerella anatipestifer]|uniref:glycosyltransferase family 4 protein n=1 Tax=Riemerella anatipestifer TaxID=34085 RepID=UPI002A84B40A|nr:glycosyltransferase family 4 protein [Riemerella anatipestifer]
MRKLFFVHDNPFFFDSETNIVYSGGSFPKDVWDNYLKNFSEVRVFGRRSKVKFFSVSSKENVYFKLTENYSSVFNFFKNFFKIQKEIEQEIIDADVVLVRLPSVLGFVAAKVAFSNNKLVWVEQVGNAKEAMSTHGSFLGKLSANIFHRINRRIVKKANFVSYVTQTKLQRDYPCCPSALQLIASNVIVSEILTEISLKKELYYGTSFKVGLLGSFDAKYKGQDVLLKAIAILSDDIKRNIELYFGGQGDCSWIVDLAKSLNLDKNIKFIGSLQAGEEVNCFLDGLSLYVQPSLTEGMPRATIEAMSRGCPVMGSDVGGIPDIVNPKLVHSRGNAKELSRQIAFLYRNRDVLFKEAKSSLKKAQPYLKERLDNKRKMFYKEMNNILNDTRE